MRRKSKKEWIYIYITESLCYTTEINTTLQINYTSIRKTFLKKDLCPNVFPSFKRMDTNMSDHNSVGIEIKMNNRATRLVNYRRVIINN